MNQLLETLIADIRAERERQLDLPGSEWDARNTPGDWAALISHYVNEEVRRNGIAPNRDDYRDSLIKAAAVIIAALENIDNMSSRDQLL